MKFIFILFKILAIIFGDPDCEFRKYSIIPFLQHQIVIW